MEKSKNTGLVVTIIILVIALLGASGFIVYDKFINTTPNEKEEEKVEDNNKEDNTETEVSTENFLIKSLYNMVQFPADNYFEKWYFYKNPKVNFNTIDNDIKLWMAYTQIPDSAIKEKTADNMDNMIRYFDISELDIAMQKVFGNDISYSKDSFYPISCECEYKYDSTNNQYSCVVNGCGGPNTSYVLGSLYKAFKNEESIILYEKFAYINIDKLVYDGSSIDNNYKDSGIYKDVDSNILIEKINNLESKIDISNYYDKLSMVKYTFNKDENGQYHFYSSEIVDNL